MGERIFAYLLAIFIDNNASCFIFFVPFLQKVCEYKNRLLNILSIPGNTHRKMHETDAMEMHGIKAIRLSRSMYVSIYVGREACILVQ